MLMVPRIRFSLFLSEAQCTLEGGSSLFGFDTELIGVAQVAPHDIAAVVDFEGGLEALRGSRITIGVEVNRAEIRQREVGRLDLQRTLSGGGGQRGRERSNSAIASSSRPR